MAEKVKKGNPIIRFLKFLFPWKGDNAGEVVRKIIFLICVIAIIVCGIYFGNRFYQRKNYENTKIVIKTKNDKFCTQFLYLYKVFLFLRFKIIKYR